MNDEYQYLATYRLISASAMFAGKPLRTVDVVANGLTADERDEWRKVLIRITHICEQDTSEDMQILADELRHSLQITCDNF